MKKETRSPQEIITGIKLGDTYSPNKFVSFHWGRWPLESEDGKYAIIMTTRTKDDKNFHKHESVALSTREAGEKIATFLSEQD